MQTLTTRAALPASIPPAVIERMAVEAVREARRRVEAEQRFSKYRTNPNAYAADVLRVKWWAKQVEIAQSVMDNRRTAVKSGHSTGKTHAIGGLVQWHFDCFNPSITLTTAPNWPSIHDLLWGEVHSQRRKDAPGRILELRLDGGPMHYATGHNAENSAGFQGRHEARQLIVIDEAQGVQLHIWEATDAMMTAPDCRVLVSGNPTETSGAYHALMSDPAWNVITISCLDHPNIAAALAGEPIPYPKAVSLTWVREMIDKHCQLVTETNAECFEFPPGSGAWYLPNDVFRSRVLGLFPKQASQSVWDEGWLEHARVSSLIPNPDTLPEIGADIARYGDDETVLYGGARPVPTHREAYARQSLTETTGRIIRLAETLAVEHGCEVKAIPIKVDDTGLGGGVTDSLAEQGYNVMGINSGERATDPAEYFNRRAELWFVAAGLGRAGNLSLAYLPPAVYRKLTAELRGVRYRIQSDKTLRVESKDDTKKRIGNSPDDADAFNLWAWPVSVAGPGMIDAANPAEPGRFSRQLTGGRWGRDKRSGWHNR